MKIKSLKLVCFSPMGITRAIIKGIARGINQSPVELINITTPEARKNRLQTSESELFVVAVPVYMGRVPALLTGWLNGIKAHNTPAEPATRLMKWLSNLIEGLVWHIPPISLRCRAASVLPSLENLGCKILFRKDIGVPLWPFLAFVAEKPALLPTANV